jgi:hypothetical protein
VRPIRSPLYAARADRAAHSPYKLVLLSLIITTKTEPRSVKNYEIERTRRKPAVRHPRQAGGFSQCGYGEVEIFAGEMVRFSSRILQRTQKYLNENMPVLDFAWMRIRARTAVRAVYM